MARRTDVALRPEFDNPRSKLQESLGPPLGIPKRNSPGYDPLEGAGNMNCHHVALLVEARRQNNWAQTWFLQRIKWPQKMAHEGQKEAERQGVCTDGQILTWSNVASLPLLDLCGGMDNPKRWPGLSIWTWNRLLPSDGTTGASDLLRLQGK